MALPPNLNAPAVPIGTVLNFCYERETVAGVVLTEPGDFGQQLVADRREPFRQFRAVIAALVRPATKWPAHMGFYYPTTEETASGEEVQRLLAAWQAYKEKENARAKPEAV
ncbi:hypothetical protein [Spirosoma sp. 209]|uniref:hypothetical protein n=1 Tax=Spirosoma sp. 209 TaxID=1955701 RepID=UPI00098D5E50|nr:hypothetical protein [Spirosoma sp. 209]